MKQWVLRQRTGFQNLQLEDASIPNVDDFDILIKFHAACLNYRALDIALVCVYGSNTIAHSNSFIPRVHILWLQMGLLFQRKLLVDFDLSLTK